MKAGSSQTPSQAGIKISTIGYHEESAFTSELESTHLKKVLTQTGFTTVYGNFSK